MKYLKRLALVCAAVWAVLCLCSCTAQQADSAAELVPILVGCDDYEPQFVKVNWEKRDEALASGQVECLWSCFTMTGREQNYQWAGPYLYSLHAVAVRADSDIYTLADLAGRKVGVQATTKPESVLLQRTDPRIPAVGRLYSCSSVSELHALLRKGYVDAIASHRSTLQTLLDEQPGVYRLLDEELYASQLGVAFARGTHTELAAQLKNTLEEMRQDGTTAQIVEKYGLDPQEAVWGGSAS